MANAINARILGDEYQALFFWLKACEMLLEYSNISSVSFEDPEIKSFDDIVIRYKTPVKDSRGKRIYVEYYQIKYHVDYRDYITLDKLLDPKFINATRNSFLQNVRDASEILNKEEKLGNSILVTPWSIHPDDELAKLKIIDVESGYFNFKKLFDGKERSIVSKLRGKMKNHLEIVEDNELESTLKPIKIWSNFYSMDILIKQLNSNLISVGLKPIDLTRSFNPYVSLIQRLFREGTLKFDKESLLKICKAEGLWVGSNIMLSEELPIGVRSFLRKAENMENETSNMICLIDYFKGRHLKSDYDWNSDVRESIEGFIDQFLDEGRSYCIHLDTHGSVAFTIGHFLDPKSGVSVVPVQKGLKGRNIWRPDFDVSKEQYSMWDVDHQLINQDGNIIVVLIEMTHSVLEDVESYIEDNHLSVKSLIRFYFDGGTSHNVIQDGIHAMHLANEIAKVLNNLEKKDRVKNYHFFGAGPNGFWFFLGQLSKVFGDITLYEYDFERTKEYSPTIHLP
ncbi:SAVED domain-containing protein [Exiguobacterium sp. s192]|uniref:SAVED domain-containing protein n=1 Tax=Exiguobacterium sp. s192 TaxID=2751206 RepID=UPI001BE9E647|nr:SAVED domain-containing protein [Exiguobacterium sp. s192]